MSNVTGQKILRLRQLNWGHKGRTRMCIHTHIYNALGGIHLSKKHLRFDTEDIGNQMYLSLLGKYLGDEATSLEG